MKFPGASTMLLSLMVLGISLGLAERGRILLQTSSSVAKTWYDWKARFPETSSMKKSELWAALGENWWLMFIDGSAHAKGQRAFDAPVTDFLSSGTNTSDKMKIAYESFKKPEAWGQRWTVEKLEALNRLFRSDESEYEVVGGDYIVYADGFVPRLAYCFDGVDKSTSHYECNEPPIVAADHLGQDKDYEMSCFLPLPCEAWCGDKRTALAQLFEEYHDDIDALVANSSASAEVLIHGIRRLAKLYYNLADLHPFGDGNSRVRNFVMQTQLIELGGHPSTMWDMYWQVYFEPDLRAEETMILQGWCAWELAYRTGHSPFVVHGNNESVPIQSYDSEVGICAKSPAPSEWYGKPV